jgi:hypothetical protein
MKNKIYSRKLGVALLLTIIATVSLFLEIATFAEWSSFSQWVFGLYAAGNIGEHFTDKIKTKE